MLASIARITTAIISSIIVNPRFTLLFMICAISPVVLSNTDPSLAQTNIQGRKLITELHTLPKQYTDEVNNMTLAI